jgi:hypothetical protein
MSGLQATLILPPRSQPHPAAEDGIILADFPTVSALLAVLQHNPGTSRDHGTTKVRLALILTLAYMGRVEAAQATETSFQRAHAILSRERIDME